MEALKKAQSNIVMVAAIAFALFTLMGVNSSLNALEDRVRVLDQTVQELNQVEENIHTLQEDVKGIAQLRNDILQAIKVATRRAAHDDRINAGRKRTP